MTPKEKNQKQGSLFFSLILCWLQQHSTSKG